MARLRLGKEQDEDIVRRISLLWKAMRGNERSVPAEYCAVITLTGFSTVLCAVFPTRTRRSFDAVVLFLH